MAPTGAAHAERSSSHIKSYASEEADANSYLPTCRYKMPDNDDDKNDYNDKIIILALK